MRFPKTKVYQENTQENGKLSTLVLVNANASLLHSCFLECHATLPQRDECCVTS